MHLGRVSRWSVIAALMCRPAFGQQQPSFKTAVDLVTVDVRVVDASGNPVTGLGKDDFTVRVDGRARPAVTVQFVDYSASAVGSATPSRGRRGVLPVLRRRRRRRAARSSCSSMSPIFAPAQRGLRPKRPPHSSIGCGRRNRIGLLTIPFTSTRLDATTDRSPIKQALRRITGHLGSVPHPLVQERSVGLSEAFALGNDKRTWTQVVTRECLEKRGGDNPDKRGEPTRECTDELEQLARALVSDARERMLHLSPKCLQPD